MPSACSAAVAAAVRRAHGARTCGEDIATTPASSMYRSETSEGLPPGALRKRVLTEKDPAEVQAMLPDALGAAAHERCAA